MAEKMPEKSNVKSEKRTDAEAKTPRGMPWKGYPLTSDLGSKRHQLRLQVHTNKFGLAELDLSNQELLTFPEQVLQITYLDALKLSNNSLDYLPSSIATFRRLKCLQLQENNLQTLPDTLTNCTRLRELNCSKNKLTSLPQNLAAFHMLHILKLAQNQFECLPHEIGLLENIRYLDVHGNQLWYLPYSLQHLKHLKYLNLSNNRFDHFPMAVCHLGLLQVLNMQGNQLTGASPDFHTLKHLKELNFGNNRLEIVPNSVILLKELRYLNVANNNLTYLPAKLSKLTKLKVLHAQGNSIEAFPQELTALQYLNLAHNNLCNFSVSDMKKLHSLNANNNHLENLPLGIFSLPKLEHLRLNTNRIQYISQDIILLKKLSTLDLGNNKLTCLPQVVNELEKLDYFNVKGNNISHRLLLNQAEIKEQRNKQKGKRRLQNRRELVSVKPGTVSSTQIAMSTAETNTQMTSQKSLALLELKDLLQRGFSDMNTNITDMDNTIESYRTINSPEDSPRLEGTWGRGGVHSLYLQSADESQFDGFDAYSQGRGNFYHDESQQDFVDYPIATGKFDDASYRDDSRTRSTDYPLLELCTELETMINKNLLQPVLSHKGNIGKSFSEKSIKETPSGLWRMSKLDPRSDSRGSGILRSRAESFLISQAGVRYTSSEDPGITIHVAPDTVFSSVHATIQLETIDRLSLAEAKDGNKIIGNILSIGHIIHIQLLDDVEFSNQVVVSIPAPPMVKRGHLHLLTVREDKSCTPCTSDYQIRAGYITLHTWSFSGKVAVITKAKCKYKACNSVEQLLRFLCVPAPF